MAFPIGDAIGFCASQAGVRGLRYLLFVFASISSYTRTRYLSWFPLSRKLRARGSPTNAVPRIVARDLRRAELSLGSTEGPPGDASSGLRLVPIWSRTLS